MSLKIFIHSFLLIFLSGCIGSGVQFNAEDTGRKPAVSTSEWTIFIYGHADHDLTPNMLVDYQEMIAANLNSKVKVILAVDVDDSYEQVLGVPYYQGVAQGTKVYEILGGGANSKLIASYPEQNFDDPAIFKSHMLSAFSSYPSKKRGVILWDHGASWDGGFGGDGQNNIRKITKGLSIHQIKSVLKDVGSKLNVGETPFDFLAFDTCLMGNIESIAELKEVAKYYFASAELDYADGWDYKNALNVFATSPTLNISQLAPSIITTWNNHHLNVGGQMDKLFRTQVAVDLSKVDSFILQMNAFLANYQNNFLADFAKALQRSGPGYGIESESQSLLSPPSYRDVGQFLSLLANSGNPALAAESLAILNFAKNQLIKARSLGDVRNGSQIGLSIESRTNDYWINSRRLLYFFLNWDIETFWSLFLDNVYLAKKSEINPPTLLTSIMNNTNPTNSNKPRVSFSTSDADVDQVELILKENILGVDYLRGVVGFGFVEDQSSYYYEWNGKYNKISNGLVSSSVALGRLGKAGLDSFGNILVSGYMIEGKITDGSSEKEGMIIGTESPFTSIAIIEENEQTTVKEISELAGLGYSFVPKIYISENPGFEYQTPIPLYSGLSELELVEVSAPAGTYKIETNLSDIWDKTSTVEDTVTVVTPF